MKNSFNILLAALLLIVTACAKKEPAEWVAGWKETSPVKEARAGAALVETNGYVYIIGGIDGKNFLNTVEYARINEDGSLGEWKSGPNLNVKRAWQEAVVHNNNIYIVGGANSGEEGGVYASNLLASVERAAIQPDGSLSSWVLEANSMNIPRRCNKVTVWGDYMYAVGGYAMVMLDLAERAKINPDGTVGKWVMEENHLQVPHYVNGLKSKKGALYVFGGHSQKNGVGMKNVEYSKLGEDGATTPWKNTSFLQTGRYGIASASHGDYFYVLGGFTGSKFLDTVGKSRIKADNELEPWQYTTPLSKNRIDYSAVVYKDRIYLVSGTNNTGYLNSVEYAQFNENGDIGFFGTKEEKAAYEKKRAEQSNAKAEAAEAEMKMEATVLSMLNSEGYSYIEVQLIDGVAWFAVPNANLKLVKGDRIRFGNGLLMPNFYSKQLQRSFKILLFMEKVEKVENPGK